MATIDETNQEAIEAWNGPLFDRFVQFRHIVVGGLAPHGEEALRLHPPAAGARVLDIGCGFGDSTQRLAGIVGGEGYAVGVDAAPRFIEAARSEAAQAGILNVSFEVADVETTRFDDSYDYAFSRFGTMFFANPVAALRHVREALAPGGRLVMVVWRRKIDNEWLYRAQTIVERFATRPEEYEEPTCGPGPFSMADADTTSHILLNAGFAEVGMRRCDLPILIGRDLDEAIEMTMSIGPAGEILRLLGDRADHVRGDIVAALREGLADMAGPEGVMATASSWVITASVPAG